MKKRIIACLAAFSVVFSLAGCKNNDNKTDGETKIKSENIILEEKEYPVYDEAYRAYPVAEGETSSETKYLDMNISEKREVFTAVVLQGIVNRKNPELYIVSKAITSGYPDFNSTEFWMNAIEEDYGVKFKKLSSFVDAIELYRDKIGGAVLYSDRLTDNYSPCWVWEKSSSDYGDMAAINLTQMICAQTDALPLTETELSEINEELTERNVTPLSVTADTRPFTDGKQPSDRTVWKECYKYALGKVKNGEWEISRKALNHRVCNSVEDTDYSVMAKLFTFNRIRDIHSSSEEKDIEREILSLTEENTPVTGCYHSTAESELMDADGNYLGYEEHITAEKYSSLGKFWYVTFGSYNLSYTSAFKSEKVDEKTDRVKYDPKKSYVSFAFTEGDNNSYANYRMIREYTKKERGSFAMTWQLSQGIYDLNPNIIRYLKKRNTVYDGYAFGSSGIGYAYDMSCPEKFGALTESYCKKSGINNVEIFSGDYGKTVKYSGYVTGMNLFAGFVGSSNDFQGENTWQIDNGNVLVQSVYFNGINPERITEGGNLINIKFHGWDSELEDIAEFVEKLPADVVTVTQSELADLIRQKAAYERENANAFSFEEQLSATESSFIEYSDVPVTIKQQIELSDNEKLVYALPFKGKSMIKAAVSGKGECEVAFSADRKKWYFPTPENGIYSMKDFGSGVDELFVMIRAKGRFIKTGVTIQTDENVVFASAVTPASGCETVFEKSVDNSDGVVTVTYSVPSFAESGDRVASFFGSEILSAEVSFDGKKFYPADNTFSADKYSNVYVEKSAKLLKVRFDVLPERLKFMPIVSFEKLNFSPCGNLIDRNTCAAGWNGTRSVDGGKSGMSICANEQAVFVFKTGDNFNKVLWIDSDNPVVVSVSVDGKNYFTFSDGQIGRVDLSSVIKNSGLIYVLVTGNGSQAVLYGIYEK